MSFIFTKENVREYPKGLLHPHGVLNGKVPIGTKFTHVSSLREEFELPCGVCEVDTNFNVNIQKRGNPCQACHGTGNIIGSAVLGSYKNTIFLGCKLYNMGSSGSAIAYSSRYFNYDLVDTFYHENRNVYYFTCFQNEEYAEKYMEEIINGNAERFLVQDISAGCFHGEFDYK